MCHFLLVIDCTRRRILYRSWDSLRQVQNRCILLPHLRLTPPIDLRRTLHGGQTMAKVHRDEEILPKASTSASTVHKR